MSPIQTVETSPVLSLADAAGRQAVYRLRHRVYAEELGQHTVSSDGFLTDRVDEHNDYIIASHHGNVVGCVSITRPEVPSLSIEKYVNRADLPIARDASVREVRLLTVSESCRGSLLASGLMYAALRWIEDQGCHHVIAMGRREVLGLYQKLGLQATGSCIKAGSVDYFMLHAPVQSLRQSVARHRPVLARIEREMNWQLDVPFHRETGCYHGGEFYEAIGNDLGDLQRKDDVINADVLDAWFPPAPRVVQAVRRELPWLARTSPPTNCEGLVDTIANVRGVDPGSILPGAGSSDLIFRALREWLNASSRVLILDPMYGEYAHVLERVVACHVDRFTLDPSEHYVIDPHRLLRVIRDGRYDMVILVNPNSPTGQHLQREDLEPLLRRIPRRTQVWIDETYIEYVGSGESIEGFAAARDNIVVCKSMSKVYALSGMRVAYLCGSARLIEPLRTITPPWVVGLPSQLAAIEALKALGYYQARYRQTHRLRRSLVDKLAAIGVDVIPNSVANFVLCKLKPTGPDTATVVARCKASKVFLRDVSSMGTLGTHALRIAVKDEPANQRIVAVLRDAIGSAS